MRSSAAQETLRPRTGIEFALRPSRLARFCGGLHVALAWVCGMDLWLRGGRLWLAAGVLASALCGALALRRWLWPRGGHTPRRLRLAGNGGVYLFTVDGQVREALVQPSSLRLGVHVLLVLVETGGRRHRLLLGPANLAPDERAALGRWLDRPPAGSAVLR